MVKKKQLSNHYKSIEKNHYYPVKIGSDFWQRLTGDINFYHDLIKNFARVANEADSAKLLDDTIKELAKSEEIQKISSDSK